MVRKILTAFTAFAIFAIGTLAITSDAFAGGRGHGHGGYYHNGHRGGLSAGEILGVGAGLMVLDHLLNANRPRVVVTPTYGYGYPQPPIVYAPAPVYQQPPIVIIVPGNSQAGQNAASDYRASVIRGQADWQARQDAWEVCRKMGPPYC